MIFDDETLMAYADGELDNASAIDVALMASPALAARAADMRALRKTIYAAFAPIAAEPVPDRLAAMLKPARKVHAAHPPVIKTAPLYPFLVLSAAAVALLACIVTTSTLIRAPQPVIVARINDSAAITAAQSKPRHAAHSPLSVPQPAPLVSQPATPVYANAVWIQQPDALTIERYYPARAAAQNIRGKAVLDCLVNSGGLIDCVVASETPGDWGFGAAAIEVSQHFEIADRASNDMRTDAGRVIIPVTFAPMSCTASPSPIAMDPETKAITDPIWVRKPSARDLARFYPPRALEAEKRGRASVRCLVALDGALTNCTTTSETPAGWGFGNAAVKLAQEFRAAPQSFHGQSTAGRVINLPITFEHRS